MHTLYVYVEKSVNEYTIDRPLTDTIYPDTRICVFVWICVHVCVCVCCVYAQNTFEYT